MVGKVVRVSPAGLFLTLPGGAVALLDRTDIPDVDGATGEGNPRVGDVLLVVILTVPELEGEVCRVVPTEPWTSGAQEADDAAVKDDGASTIGAVPGLIAAAGAVMAIVGAFLPWVQVPGILGLDSLSVTGTDGDGILTLSLGIVTVPLALWAGGILGQRSGAGRSRSWTWAAVTILGVLSFALAIYHLVRIRKVIADVPAPSGVSLGTGLLLALAGAGIVFVAGCIGLAGSGNRSS